MSTYTGEHYPASAAEEQLLGQIIAAYSGQSPEVIRQAVANEWMQLFSSGAGADQYDWFDYVAMLVSSMPTQTQQATRAAIMGHAESTKHTVKLINASDSSITVACPWSPNQATS